MASLTLFETPAKVGYKIYELRSNWDIWSATMSQLVVPETPALCHDIKFKGQPIICCMFFPYDDGERPPSTKCNCGYHFANSPDFPATNYYRGQDSCLFEIAPYGRVIETEYGGRAEYFKVLKVIMSEEKYASMQLPAKYPVIVLQKPKRKHVWLSVDKAGLQTVEVK